MSKLICYAFSYFLSHMHTVMRMNAYFKWNKVSILCVCSSLKVKSSGFRLLQMPGFRHFFPTFGSPWCHGNQTKAPLNCFLNLLEGHPIRSYLTQTKICFFLLLALFDVTERRHLLYSHFRHRSPVYLLKGIHQEKVGLKGAKMGCFKQVNVIRIIAKWL